MILANFYKMFFHKEIDKILVSKKTESSFWLYLKGANIKSIGQSGNKVVGWEKIPPSPPPII